MSAPHCTVNDFSKVSVSNYYIWSNWYIGRFCFCPNLFLYFFIFPAKNTFFVSTVLTRPHNNTSLTLIRQTCCRILRLTGRPSIPNTVHHSFRCLLADFFSTTLHFSHFFLQSFKFSPILFSRIGSCSRSSCIPSFLF